MLEEKDSEGAKNKLEEDIKDKLEKWLVVYEKENVLQFSKDEIIDLVDKLIERF